MLIRERERERERARERERESERERERERERKGLTTSSSRVLDNSAAKCILCGFIQAVGEPPIGSDEEDSEKCAGP